MQEERQEGREGARPAGTKKSPVLLIVVILVVLCIGGAAGAYFLFMAPKGKQATPQAVVQASAQALGEGAVGPMKPLDAFIVNLTDGEGTRYLKAVMQLEMDNEMLGAEIDGKMAQIRDEIIMLLSSKSFDDLSTVPGKRALKRGIVDSINKYLVNGKVRNVFFSEFVVQ